MASQLQDEARRLGERVEGDPEHAATAVPRLAEILALGAQDEAVLVEAVDALGKAYDTAAAQALLADVPADHPSAAVRLALVRALPGGVVTPGPLRDRVVAELVRLTRDEEPRVRDWAAFGLRQVDADEQTARDALAARLDDPDAGARGEALVALAATGDRRAVDALLGRLDGEEDLRLPELEAAALLADPALHEPLERLAAEWAGDDDEFTEPLRLARARCRPDSAEQAALAEARALRAVRATVPTGFTAQLHGSYPRSVVRVAHDRLGTIDFALWAEGEDPWDHPTTDVIDAVTRTFGAQVPDRRR
ncbi:HEAT repeat domain-containing protein [Motilibacter aurantiacus]|uniref:HEAT repeat domain-containing protein n=1 Tax=Motilibacter aurantiacus TaxID=2714955 RepID=UPI0014076A61|nr:HEAT repeat domain-containing protein [Motilibacter aurantiacus]NHC45153.1 hypothetical protein [Motilibacter aurantiacus]